MKVQQIVVIPLIIILLLGLGVNMFSEQNTEVEFSLNKSIQDVITPIVINGDTELENQAASSGWDVDGRDGSKNLPYLIYDDLIMGGGSSKVIDIRNTRYYFIIDQLTILGGSTAIYLENVSNAVISNTFINASTMGVDIRKCDNIKILSNEINYSMNAIYCYRYCNNSLIDSNIINTAGSGGIYLDEYCYYNNVTNNKITNVENQGISTDRSDYNIISNNSIDGLYDYNSRGMEIYYSSNNTITNNTITNGQKYGIMVVSLCQWNEIAFNNLTDTGEVGIYVWDTFGTNNTIHHNRIISHNVGIATTAHNNVNNNYMKLCSTGINVETDAIVRSNHISDCNKGIQINGENNIIEDNFIEKSSTGLYGYYSGTNILLSNHVDNCSYSAIALTQSTNYDISSNILTNNVADLRFSASHMIYLYHNISNNFVDGKEIIYVRNTENPIIPNDIRRVILINCSNFDISGQIFENTHAGVMAFECSDFRIHNNIFRYLTTPIETQLSENISIDNNEMHNCTGGTGVLAINIDNILIYNNQMHTSQFTQSSINSAIYFESVHVGNVTANTFFDSYGTAIRCESTENITINQNRITFMNRPVLANVDYYLVISNNYIKNCTYGLSSSNSYYGKIYGNWIENTLLEGVDLYNVDYYQIYLNNFVNNNQYDTNQAQDLSGFSNIFSYNYWNDHEGVDTNLDGLKDTQYDFPSNFDNASLVFPYIISLPTILTPSSGAIVNRTITITWEAATDTLGYDITYYVYVSPNGGESWIALDKMLETTSIEWNTSIFENGTNYLIRVLAVNEFSVYTEALSDPFTVLNLPRQLTVPTIVFPVDGSIIAGSINIQWSPSVDIWNSSTPVNYAVYYSDDNGITWHEITVDISATSFAWITEPFADGSYLIKIIAYTYDGLNKQDIISVTLQNTIITTTESLSTTTSIGSSTEKSQSTTSGFTIMFLLCSFTILIWRKKK